MVLKREKLDDSMTICGRNGDEVPMEGEVSADPGCGAYAIRTNAASAWGSQNVIPMAR
jgi:hypothetical protein